MNYLKFNHLITWLQDKMQIKDNRQTTTQDYLNSISGRYVGRVVGTLASWVEAQGHLIKVWYISI